MFGQLSGYGEAGQSGQCSISVRFALKLEVDMLKMWVHERTTAENNPTNHYQLILIPCNDHQNFFTAISVHHVW